MKNSLSNLKLTWNYVKKNKKELYTFIFLNILIIIIGIVVPILSAQIIVNLTSNKFNQLLWISLIVFIIENIRNLIHFYGNRASQILYRESMSRIQNDLGKNILKLENNILDKNGSGVFIQRMTNDTARLADIYDILTVYVSRIITNLGIFVAVFIINKLAFLFLLLSVIIRYLIEYVRNNVLKINDKEARKEADKASSFASEMIRGARDIKMLNAEESFEDALNERIIALNSKRYNMAETNRRYGLLRGFAYDLSDLLLIILLVQLIVLNKLEVAYAIIIYNYSSKIPSIVNDIGTLLDKMRDFNLSAERIYSIINSEEFKKEQFGSKHINKVKGDFEFRNVTFKYEEEEILKDLSFKIEKNTTTAFVGKSGAGKSTIFNLLCKMYDIDSGEILIDGININELDKDSIRGNITIISQSPYIFNLSIKENLRLVKKDLTDKEMKQACHLACLDEFIESLPEKYDTIVGEGGVNLSGGQKQRLAIARALIQKTEIILFDEATSALDNETQSKIQDAIKNMKGKYTILIIAHRLSTVIDSDKIFIIEEGKVIDSGTHKELLKKSDFYKQLYEKDLKK